MLEETKVKERTPNEQFATSGGATRPSGSAEQHFLLSSEPYRYPRLRQAATTLGDTRGQHSAKTG